MNILFASLLLLLAAAAALLAAAWYRALQSRHRCERELAEQRRQNTFLQEQHRRETEQTALLHEKECAHLREQLTQAQDNHRREQAEQERRWEESRKAMTEQFKTLAGEVLAERSKQLKTDNGEQMGNILRPLREQLEGLGKMVRETREADAAGKASLETVMREMMDQTRRIGRDAVNLTHALKGDSKKQGDWGEMILESILEGSGLERGVHYVVQESVTTEENARLRPDVIVRFPNERSVVIDSKVSLVDYARYMEAEDETARKTALKAHIASVRKHIEELADKQYDKHVKEAIGYVLMFIPNEASYIAAVREDPNLTHDAFRRQVLLVSPTNLLMALQLAYNLWQNEKQQKNVEEICACATKLYEKFYDFHAAFSAVGDKLKAAQDSFETAQKRLNEGKGNYLSRVDKLRALGISPNPKKLLPTPEAEGTEEE
ncbi:MAG: DNA recombination protein RmuC [Akkermansia sp.]|nr:DNA recombination protein RmuC [Akkermansia sp.]